LKPSSDSRKFSLLSIFWTRSGKIRLFEQNTLKLDLLHIFLFLQLQIVLIVQIPPLFPNNQPPVDNPPQHQKQRCRDHLHIPQKIDKKQRQIVDFRVRPVLVNRPLRVVHHKRIDHKGDRDRQVPELVEPLDGDRKNVLRVELPESDRLVVDFRDYFEEGLGLGWGRYIRGFFRLGFSKCLAP
jgi:hypothetical protein